MAEDKYVAYVGSYTHDKAKGISLYDVDVKAGKMVFRNEYEVNNSSYVLVSHSGNFLYSIVDEGIATFKIESDGSLTFLANSTIKGMRGCHLTLTNDDSYIFVSGYHDGKLTVLAVGDDGIVGNITCEIFHKGMGSIAERNFRPHINCSMLTPDEKFLCVCDLGLDQVKVYNFNKENGTLKLFDIIRCQLESAPRDITFSPNGKYAYVLCELKNYINVYKYNPNSKTPFEFIQNIFTVRKGYKENTAAAALQISSKGTHLFCSNAGDESLTIYTINEDGTLELRSSLPISGNYPKDIALFPDEKHIAITNHESGTITFFTIDYNKCLIVMNGKPLKVDTPNCMTINKIKGK